MLGLLRTTGKLGAHNSCDHAVVVLTEAGRWWQTDETIIYRSTRWAAVASVVVQARGVDKLKNLRVRKRSGRKRPVLTVEMSRVRYSSRLLPCAMLLAAGKCLMRSGLLMNGLIKSESLVSLLAKRYQTALEKPLSFCCAITNRSVEAIFFDLERFENFFQPYLQSFRQVYNLRSGPDYYYFFKEIYSNRSIL